MTIKYLAGNRVQGTSYDRFAITGRASGVATTPDAQSLNLDGSNDYVDIGGKNDFKFLHDGSSWSIRIRILPDDVNSVAMILNNNGSTNTNLGLQMVGMGNGGAIRMRISDGVSGDLVTNTTATSFMTNDTWSEIVATYNGTNLILYHNGGSADSASNSNTNYKKTQAHNSLRIGSTSDSNTTWAFDGSFDELGIWKDRVLTSTEITELYNSGTHRLCSYYPENLRLYLNFNTPTNHGAPNENWLKNKAPVFPDGTIFEEIDTHRSYIYDSDSGTTNTAKDFWTEIT